jgi:hypothetical protein
MKDYRGMPLLKVEKNQIIGTESIITADFWDGSPIVRGPEPPSAPSPESATLTITLSGNSEIKLEGKHAITIWKRLEELADR